jgi:hypothetical protein
MNICTSESYGKNSDMSEGTEIGSGIEAFSCRVLHEDRRTTERRFFL